MYVEMRCPIRRKVGICLELFLRGANRFEKNMVARIARSWSAASSVVLSLPFGDVPGGAEFAIFVTHVADFL